MVDCKMDKYDFVEEVIKNIPHANVQVYTPVWYEVMVCGEKIDLRDYGYTPPNNA